jgi:mono/diheme cytochrome c family protein
MKRRFVLGLFAVLLVMAALFFFVPARLDPVQASASQASGAALLARGRYLATATDCAARHSVPGGRPFAGGLAFDRETGIGNWSVDEIAQYFGTGHATGRGAASGSMAEAVNLSLSKLTPADPRAMAVYLHAIPPQHTEASGRVDPKPPALAASTLYSPPPGETRGAAAGLRLYEGACASCHGWNGEGVQSIYGSLRGAQTVNDPAADNLIQVILHGSSIQSPQGRVTMPAFGAMTDAEVSLIANYVLRHFGNKQGAVTPARVADVRRAGT